MAHRDNTECSEINRLITLLISRDLNGEVQLTPSGRRWWGKLRDTLQ